MPRGIIIIVVIIINYYTSIHFELEFALCISLLFSLYVPFGPALNTSSHPDVVDSACYGQLMYIFLKFMFVLI